jgi:hypothetical protein
MSNQMLAKVGVIGLIALNLGAYYFLWPGSPWHQHAENNNSAPTAPSLEKGDKSGKPVQVASTAGAAQPTQLGKPSAVQPPPLTMMPADPAPPSGSDQNPTGAKPTDPAKAIPSAADKDLFVIALPPIPDPNDPSPATGNRDTGASAKPEVVVARAEDPTIEQLKRLKNSFAKETSKPGTGNLADPPALVPAENINLKPVPQENPAGKADSSAWTFQMEIAGAQKVVTARLNKQTEFRILCDHVEMKTTEGAVVAVGHVAVIGPGLKGTCNRLILRLAGESLILDGKAELQIQQGNVVEIAGQSVELKGELLTFRLQQAAPAAAASANPPPPATVPTGLPNPFTPAPPFAVDKK